MASIEAFCMSATPFSGDGGIDEGALRAHLDRMVAARIGVYLGSGGAGEGHALSEAEFARLYEIGVDVCKGRIPVYANPPEQRTAAAMKRLALLASRIGIDVVQVYPLDAGHGMRPTELELLAYYDDVLSAIETPTALSVHAVVGYVPPVSMVIGLCNRYPTIRAVNLIGVGLDYLCDLRAAIRPSIAIYVPVVGCLDAFALGADGFLGAEANIVPESCRGFLDALAAGDPVALGDAYRRLLEFSRAVAPWSPSTARWVKMCLRLLSLPGGEGGLRRPYLMPPETEMQRLAEALRALGMAEISDRL